MNSARESYVLPLSSGNQFETWDSGLGWSWWTVWSLRHNLSVAYGYWWNLGTPCRQDHQGPLSQTCDVPPFPDLPCPSEFPQGQPPVYSIAGLEDRVGGRVGGGHRHWSWFALEHDPVQGRQYCHPVGGICMAWPMRWVQSSMRQVVMSMASRFERLTLMADCQMVFKVIPLDKHPHVLRIWRFECV